MRLVVERSNTLVWSQTAVFVPPGTRVRHDIAIDACPVRLLIVDANGEPVAGVELGLFDDSRRLQHGTPRSTESGIVALEVEPGRFSVRTLPRSLQAPGADDRRRRDAKGGDPFAAHWIEIGEVTASRGTAQQTTLRLPPEWFR